MEAFDSRTRRTKAGELTRACLRAPFDFTVHIRGRDLDAQAQASLKQALIALGTFGGMGARSRKGYGSLALRSLCGDGVEGWRAPRNVAELKREIVDLRGDRGGSAFPAFTAISDRTRHVLLSSRNREPVELLDLVGRELVRYRSWGRNGKILGDAVDSEKNFEDDHDLMKGNIRENSHPRRVAFGLPHNYGKRKEKQIGPHARELDRRASPLFVHIHECGNSSVAVLSFLPARFLPEGKVRHFGRWDQSRAETRGQAVSPDPRVPQSPSRSGQTRGTLHRRHRGPAVTIRLDVSIGPVQGFVARSRRTRDLWGSSYLLSVLSGHAMRGAAKAGGRIVQPTVDEDLLYRWIGGDRSGKAPRIGSLPNRFAVEADGDPRAVADAAIEALGAAWDRVCEAVWTRFVEHAADAGDGTRAIWKRQVGAGAFWEVSWTAGSLDAAGGLLARRKHWRSCRPSDEHGDKCAVMHDLQELSGYVRARGADDRRKQNEFWSRIRKGLGSLDLRGDERRGYEQLCAVALVKRLFPKAAPDALGWDVDTSHWQSTVYVGALPWIRRAMAAEPGLACRYADAVRACADDGLTERRPPFAGLDEPAAGDFPKLDANWLHREAVRSERLCPLPDDSEGNARADLERRLEAIYDARDEAGGRIGPPSSFYALLLADGDRLGKLVGELGGEVVGKALRLFTREAPEIVCRHDGVTVYAGGDDVLGDAACAGGAPLRGIAGRQIQVGVRRTARRHAVGRGRVRSRPTAARRGARGGPPPPRRCRQGGQWARFARRGRAQAGRPELPMGHRLDREACGRRLVARGEASRPADRTPRRRSDGTGSFFSVDLPYPRGARHALRMGCVAPRRVGPHSGGSRYSRVPARGDPP